MQLLDIHGDGKKYKDQVYQLYEEAFPAEEKKPVRLMEALVKKGKMELLAVAEDEEFVGLAMNMLSEGTALLDYFAISPAKRSGGYGGRAVKMLQERFAGKKYIIEIEMQDSTAENAEDRRRRKAFYLRNGLKETNLFANVYSMDFELLTPDGKLSFEEYIEMLRHILGEDGVRVLKPRLIREAQEGKE